MGIVGVPASLENHVYERLTPYGALTNAVANRNIAVGNDVHNAVNAITTGIAAEALNRKHQRYSRNMGVDTYPGLGDTSWLDVAKTFVDEIGKGIGGKIAGRDPYQVAPKVVPYKPPPTPWGTYALVGGGVLLAGLLLVKVLK